MTSKQIIEDLKDVIASLKLENEIYRLEREAYRLEREQDKHQINALLAMITDLRKEIKSLHEAIDARNADLTKAENINKGLSKIISNKSEKRQPKPSEEDRKTLEAARAAATKARGNNGAKRDLHPENAAHMTIVYVTPDDPDFNIALAELIGGKDQDGNPKAYLESRRYRYHRGFMETVLYRAPLYKQDKHMYRGKAPGTLFLNSSYESSAISFLMRMRFGYGMTVESICCMLREDGFNMNRKTADGLFRKTVRIPESLYKALRIAVRQSDYLNIDGTYHRILSEKKTDMKDENSDKEASGEDLANRKDMDKNDSAQETGMNDASAVRGSRKGHL